MALRIYYMIIPSKDIAGDKPCGRHTPTSAVRQRSSGAWLTTTTRRVFHEKFQKFIYCPTVAQKRIPPNWRQPHTGLSSHADQESSNTPHHSDQIRINMLALYVIIIKQKFFQTSFQEISAPKNSNNFNHAGSVYFSAGGPAIVYKIWHHMVIVPWFGRRRMAGPASAQWSTSYD